MVKDSINIMSKNRSQSDNDVAVATQLATQAARSAKESAIAAAIVGVKIDNIEKSVSRIEVTLKDQADKAISRGEFNDVLKVQGDHEERTRVLEETRWKIAGIAGFITGLLSIFGSYLIQSFTH